MDIYITIGFRVVTIMLVLLISALIISGRRTIGELPVFDLLTIIVIGSITGADIAEPDLPHFHIIFAIVMTFLFQRIMNVFYLKSKTFRKLTSFQPIIVVQDGKMVYENIKSIKYSIDEVLTLLRQNNVFDINEVRYAILEPDGELSILKKSFAQPLVKKDTDCQIEQEELTYTVILDGKLENKNLKVIGINKDEMLKLVKKEGYNDYGEIFFASMDKKKNIYISPYNFKSDEI
ncbi:DUF421 domain-containing protein [Vallitalea okinawensis]|uniref:DUF421 domain-containing protein n=1 Tax=Vallitalea okinawensis TaxID=2078660 RepID=UPI000CFB5D24|nr:DUF421 domain-containing protein [Vallitalea okinawensis]